MGPCSVSQIPVQEAASYLWLLVFFCRQNAQEVVHIQVKVFSAFPVRLLVHQPRGPAS